MLDTGELVSTEVLGHPAVSTTVHRTLDGTMATDGLFAELKKVLASFAVIDVADRERAVEIASRIVQLYREAAALSDNQVERRYLLGEADRLT
ncbi:YciI family protein [Streptomyces anulatus]|uniref:YciI family protein n=1 Tax=Streptomyces TaxID=1883 RepID=UPI00031F13A9|nr:MULTISPECIES: YciI family protein [Streptomyces]MCX4521899.1 YciI family protein [Streptomyces anulatus]MCX4604775.1 YciI family protein [Streptomyces anulatus]